MRILIVDTCYPAFVDAHYGSNPGLERAPYAAQWRALMDTFFGTADSYSHYLGQLGHEAHEVVVDCAPLQRAWASEHPARRQFRLRPLPPTDEILVRQAEWFEPDVVYVQNLSYLSDGALARLKRISGFLVGQLGTEAPPDSRLRNYDLLLTSFPHFVARLRARGMDAEYLRIGFDERVLDRLDQPAAERYGAVFVGALSGTQWRQASPLFERAANRVAIDFWGYGTLGLPPTSPILKRYHGEAWGIDMFRVLRASKIAVNRHGDVAERFANNMRLFEATGAGTMLLTDEKSNVPELFEPGREVETYAGEDELVEKIVHYLEHDDERSAIARAGQERTLREHTYGHRMRELVGLLEAHRGSQRLRPSSAVSAP
jgi:spore maturation protein CgeB